MLLQKKYISVFAIILIVFSILTVCADENSQYDTLNNQITELQDKFSVLDVIDNETNFEDIVTRGEFVKYLLKTLDITYNFNSNGTQFFQDVSNEYSESVFINTAYSLNIISMPDNKQFYPDSPITLQAATKMIVSLMGYEEHSQSKGGYPSGYLIMANQLKLLDNLKFLSNNDPLNLTAVLKLIDNSLDKPLVTSINFDADGGAQRIVSGSNGTEKMTILSEYRGITLSEGNLIQYDMLTNKVKYNQTKPEQISSVLNYDNKSENISSLIGLKVITWLMSSDKSTTENDTLLFIKAANNYEVYYSYIEEVNNQNSFSFYSPAGIKKIKFFSDNKRYNLNSDVEIKENGEQLVVGRVFVGQLCRIVTYNGDITIIDLIPLQKGGILKNTIMENKISYIVGSRNDISLLIPKETRNLTVLLDLKVSSLDKLCKDLYFDYYYDENLKRFTLVASSKKVKGVLKSICERDGRFYLEINDFEYPVLKQNGTNPIIYMSNDKGVNYLGKRVLIEDVYDVLNTNVTAYVTGNNTINYLFNFSEENTNEFYAVVLNSKVEAFEDSVLLKIYTQYEQTEELIVDTVAVKRAYNNNGGYNYVDIDEVIKSQNLMTGESVFKFYLNNKREIVKISKPKFENLKIVQNNYEKFSNEEIPQLKWKDDFSKEHTTYLQNSKIMWISKINGEKTAKMVDWNKELKNRTIVNDITFQMEKNKDSPEPEIVILPYKYDTDSHGETLEFGINYGYNYGILKSISTLPDDKVGLYIINGDKTDIYKADKEDVKQLQENSIIEFAKISKIDGSQSVHIKSSPESIYNFNSSIDDWLTVDGGNGMQYTSKLYNVQGIYFKATEDSEFLQMNKWFTVAYKVGENNSFTPITIDEVNLGDEVWYYCVWGQIRMIFVRAK